MAVRSLPDLYLMRHGQTEWNVQGRMQGRQDSPLTPLGLQQARRQAWLVRDLPDLARYASTAGRAQQTARIVFGAQPFRSDPRLEEIDIGDFTGQTSAALRAAHPAIFDEGMGWYDHAPGGEGFAGLRARLSDFLDDLQEPALIVTHGITLRMLAGLALGLEAGRLTQIPIMQGALLRLRAGESRLFL